MRQEKEVFIFGVKCVDDLTSQNRVRNKQEAKLKQQHNVVK